MIRVKKLFYSIIIALACLGCLCFGLLFQNGNGDKKAILSSAATPTYGFISNNLPTEGYFTITPSTNTDNAVGYVGNEVYLFQPNSTLTISMANDTITGIVNQENQENPPENFAFIPTGQPEEGVAPQEYYYFDFQNSLALYYNLTNEQIAASISGTNLLDDQSITNFVKKNDNPFAVDAIDITPEQFNLTFSLLVDNSSETTVSIEKANITLHKEGIYTLQIPFVLYHTINGGTTFSSTTVTINYTFMVFESDTYFNNTTGLQNISIDDNMQESAIASSESFSRYYFYNYSHYDSVRELPKISYNPNLYRITVNYTDINNNNFIATLDFSNRTITQYDALGNIIASEDYFVFPVYTNDIVNLYFTDLGTYDISFEYLYVSSLNDTTTTYELPFENLSGNTNLQNKSQRLYIYGYQAVYSDYSSLDPNTNQPENAELKTFKIDEEGGKYENNADITSEVNASMTGENLLHGNMASPSSSSSYPLEPANEQDKSPNLLNAALNYVNNKKIIPVSTNQTPVKFLNNVSPNSSYSKIYSVSGEAGEYELTELGSFQGFNQNTAGTYLYIIQYTYENYMSTSGTLQQSYYHYQIFFFEVTNITPTLTVLDESYKEIYNGGFTNQSVYVLNDAENNIYDAQITIKLSAYDYQNKQYFFKDVNVNDLDAYGMSYGQFDEEENEAIQGEYGFRIDNGSQYANARFTVTIETMNSNSPGIKEFTIDTNEITGIATRNVRASSGTQYSILSNFDKYNTNQSFIYSWNEKASDATTYGYITRIDLQSINYYSSQATNSLSSLLNYWIGQGTLPVSFKLDISKQSSWREYQNTINNNNVVDATYVLSTSGLYILEVYDNAGNSAFYITLLDTSEPIFVQISSGNTTSYQILANSQTISIPEDGTQISINWSDRKAIYIENRTGYQNIQPYSSTVNFDAANENLQACLKAFFESDQNGDIFNVSSISVSPVTNSDTGISTGLTSYNGYYLAIDINDTAYVKDAKSSSLGPYNGNNYQINFFNENNKAIEGSYIISIIDDSNTKITGNASVDYTNYSSSYVTFNVTSDAARLSVYYTENSTQTQLILSSYDLTGNLYKENDDTLTHLPKSDATMTDLTYKFAYYTPINADNEITISYVPFADNGSILQSLTLQYYPYVQNNESNTVATGKLENNNGQGRPVTEIRQEYYYTISEKPTQSINIYTYNESVTYDSGETLTFTLALGSSNLPLDGRYVLTREYRTENQDGESGRDAYSAYDYFRRTLTFDVDSFSLISQTENITSGQNSSLESIVGGDIFVNMYSGRGNTSIQVSFPTYINGLNSGSFYTDDSFTETSNVSKYAVSGDKLPISLFIPGVKYTKYNTISYNDNGTTSSVIDNSFTNTGDDTLNFSSVYNDKLSYYGNASVEQRDDGLWYIIVEGVVDGNGFTSENEALNYLNSQLAIAEYKIKANITASLANGSTRYYTTNGNLSNGFLQFYEADKNFNITNTNAVENFYLEGNYEITIYQASNLGQVSNFYSLYKFGFEIISQAPDFDIIGGDGYTLSEVGDTNTYYTNSNELTIQWEIPTSIYKAKIDESAIQITSTEGSLPMSEITGENIRSFTIDTSSLAKSSRANPALTITMQYEGYNSSYYRQISKTIYFDISAPTANLQNLMANTENATDGTFTSNFQLLSMRRYFDNDHQEVAASSISDVTNMSYSYSANTGYFQYYSYNVTTDFFYETLMETVNNAHLNNYNTQYIYYKEVPSLDSYTQVDRDSFSANQYTLLLNSDNLGLRCGYYEIVERDYAGNMCVYLVYLIDTDSLQDDENVTNEALIYSNDTHDEDFTITNEEITSGYNIYSNSGFTLKNYNYMSDPWGMIYVRISGQNIIRYLKSPWLEDGFIYRMTINASGYTLESVTLASIFANVDSSSSKHALTLADRTTGVANQVYLSIMDASINTQKVEDPNGTNVILNISIPTLSEYQSTTTSYVFPEKITIYRFDNTTALQGEWTLIYIADQYTYGTWTPDPTTPSDSITFNTINSGSTLQIVINMGNYSTSKIRFEILDNFGNTTTVIQLANEIAYDEISGEGAIYQTTENDGSITYISDQAIRFSYNNLLYNVAIFDADNQNITQNLIPNDNPATNISYYTLSPTTENIWDDYYRIEITDSETGLPIKTLHLRLYYVLPFITGQYVEVSNGGILFSDNSSQPLTDFGNLGSTTVYFEGKPFTANAHSLTTYSQVVTLRFKDGQGYAYEGLHAYQNGYSYSVYLSSDNGQTWTNINSPTSATTAYAINGTGIYTILIKYDDEQIFSNICQIYQINILDSEASYYYITVDGLEVTRSDFKFTDQNGREYEVNYIIGVNYSDKNNRLAIIANEELGVTYSLTTTQTTGTDVYIEIYHYECTQARGDFTIIYIEENNNFVSQFTYETASGTNESIKTSSSVVVVANNETESNFDRLKLEFTSYYGIKENAINIEVLKLFNGSYLQIYPTKYTNGDLSYIYLDKAGSYRVKLYDSCTPANVQQFKNGEYLDIIFLNYTPFIVTYTDYTQEEPTQIQSEFIQNGVYNGTVVLSMTNLSTYYQLAGYPVISVKLNGKDFKDYQSKNNVYTFTQPGYYSITFTATYTTGIPIRQQEFNFTILNASESRYAYEFPQFNSYYIEKIVKDNIDITDSLTEISNLATVTIDGKKYLSELIVNYLDEKTGAGRYQITINTNDNTYRNIASTSFTFNFWINKATPPLNISVAEGQSTTDNIIISFNVQNLYDAIGECYLQIGNTRLDITQETIPTLANNLTYTIDQSGTYYVQVYSMSGHLLYSYKVIKDDPLNAFAIIAIVLGVIAVGAVIGITIALRKRQKVK